jgi:hypothetical protein
MRTTAGCGPRPSGRKREPSSLPEGPGKETPTVRGTRTAQPARRSPTASAPPRALTGSFPSHAPGARATARRRRRIANRESPRRRRREQRPQLGRPSGAKMSVRCTSRDIGGAAARSFSSPRSRRRRDSVRVVAAVVARAEFARPRSSMKWACPCRGTPRIRPCWPAFTCRGPPSAL